MLRRLAVALILAIVCAGPVHTARADSPVTLRTQATIEHTAIRLSDVFDGLPEGRDRDIALAPAPGKSVVYDARVLWQLAQAYRLDWQPRLGDYAKLTTAATVISAGDIRKAVLQKLTGEGLQGDVTLVFDGHEPTLNLPADRAPDFSLENFTYDTDAHRFRADLVVTDNAIPSVGISGRVTVMREVPTLNRRLERGTVVASADIVLDKVSDERIGSDVLTEESDLIGKELRHDMAAGALFRAHDLSQPRLVTRGSLVMLKIETSSLIATAQGRAMQDGSHGDVVRVTNTQSQRQIEGVVIAPGVVKVGNTATVRMAEAN